MRLSKNWRQRFAAVIVCLAVTGTAGLAGCSSKPGDSEDVTADEDMPGNIEDVKAMGRYLEEEVSLPEGCRIVEDMEMIPGGVMRIVYRNEAHQLMVADSGDKGNIWTEKFNVTENAGEPACPAVLDKDGGVFIAGTEYKGKEEGKKAMVHCFYISPQGQKKELNIGGDLGGNHISRSKFSASGKLLVKAGNNILEIDIEKDAVSSVYEKGSPVNNFDIAGNILITILDKEIHYYDLDTGKPLDGLEPLTEQIAANPSNMFLRSIQIYPILFLDGDVQGSLFYVDQKGMYRYAIGGSVIEQLIDGQMSVIGSPVVGLVDVVQDEGGNFYVAVWDNSVDSGSSRLLRYTYSKDTPSAPDTEVTVYSLRESDVLKQTGALFQERYPDIYFNYETGMTGEDAVTAPDAVKALNTQIMAGKGPDILILDDMQTEAFIENGMLSDISSLFEDIEILDNIKNAYTEEDGSIYMLPIRFGIPVLQGRKENLEGIEDLKSLADKVEEKEYSEKFIPTSAAYYPERLLRRLSFTSFPAWFQDDGTLDREKISEYLEQVNRIYKAGRESVEKYKELNGISPVSKYRIEIESAYTNSVLMQYDDTLLEIGDMDSPAVLAAMDSAEKKDGSLTAKLWNGQTENCFLPVGVIGISERSQNKKAAEKFIRFAFDKEGQTSQTGLPVNKSVYEDMSYWRSGEEGQIIDVSNHYYEGKGSVELEVRLPGDEAIKKMQAIGKSLTVPTHINEIILDAVTDSGVEYLSGKIPLEEAAERIMGKVKIYLAE